MAFKVKLEDRLEYMRQALPKMPKVLEHATFDVGDKVRVAWEDGKEYDAIIEHCIKRRDKVVGYRVLWATGEYDVIEPKDIRALVKKNSDQ